jgi:hypothetical protein
MGFWHDTKAAVARIWQGGTSKLEMALVRAIGYAYGRLGAWSANRYEQAQHVTGWTYVGIKAICEEFAMVAPQIAYVLPPEQATPERRALGRILQKHIREKVIANIQNHEELELVDSDHRLYQLLRNPNPVDTGYDLRYELMMNMEAHGNGYILIGRDLMGLPNELWVMPSTWIRARADTLDGSRSTRFVEWYDCCPRSFGSGSSPLRIRPEDIIPFQYKNLLSKFDGLSPMQATAPWTDVAESIDISQYASFKNRAVTDIVIESDPKFLDMNKDTAKRAQEQFKEKYGGEANSGIPWLLPPGATAKKLSPTPAEMDYVRSAEQARDWCLAARRVSKIIAGIDEAGSYNNMITSTANFVMRTMRPKRMLIGEVLTQRLAKEFDERLCIFWPDTTPEDPAQVLAENIAKVACGAKTVNEWRQECGDEPYPHGGDDPMVNGQETGWVSGKKPLDLASLMGSMGQKPGLPGTREEQQEGKLKVWVGKDWKNPPTVKPTRKKYRSKGLKQGASPEAPSKPTVKLADLRKKFHKINGHELNGVA